MTHKSGGVDEDSNFVRYALGRDIHSGHLALPHKVVVLRDNHKPFCINRESNLSAFLFP